MNLIQLAKLIQSEQDCEEYLRSVGILKTFTTCAKCNASRIGRVRRNRYKCYECNYEWNIRKGSVLEGMILESSKFIACIKMFEIGITIEKCYKELEMAHETVSCLFNLIRNRIVDSNQLSALCFQNRSSSENKLFIVKNGTSISVLTDCPQEKEKTATNYLQIITMRSKNAYNQNGFIYGCRKHGENVKEINLLDQFWKQTKRKLETYNIIQYDQLYSILKDLEFRFNNREGNLFELLLNLLVAE